MEQEKTFKTKTGFCHILPDKIVLSRDGVVGNVANVAFGNNILRSLLIYGVLSIMLFYFGFEEYQKDRITQCIIFGLLGLYLVYVIINSLNNSATPVIDRDKIKSIKFKKAIVGLTRSRFEILFENENGKIKKRLIMLPGSLSEGQGETQKALKIMTDEQLLNA